MRWVSVRGPVLAMLVMGVLPVAGCVRNEVPPPRLGSIKDDVADVAGERGARRTAAAAPSASGRIVTGSISRGEPTRPAPSLAPSPAPASAPAKAAATTATSDAANGAVVAAVAPPPSVPDDPAVKALTEGRRLFSEGKVIEARRRFITAMDGPAPDATLALARSFDSNYLSDLQTSDGAPDLPRALTLYERAAKQGSTEAAADLERIRGRMGSTAPAAVEIAPASTTPIPAASAATEAGEGKRP